MNMKLEVVIVPVSDVDRAKAFYEKVGFRLDIDIVNENFRGIQFTPPRSEASIIFGKGVTPAKPGSAAGTNTLWTTAKLRVGARPFVTVDAKGNTVNRCEGVAFAGGAAFSSEEGYLAAKLMRSLGVVHIEQQARV